MKQFDKIFDKYRGGAPLAFIRALALHESGLDPTATARTSSATGLFQVTSPVLADYNKQHHTTFRKHDLMDPDTGSRVGIWHVLQIANAYRRQMPIEWTSPRFAGLVALGFVAGWSARQGVLGIFDTLRRSGIAQKDIGYETVIDAASHLYPSLQIYNTGGGYMSDPSLRKHIAKILRDGYGVPIPASILARRDHSSVGGGILIGGLLTLYVIFSRRRK